MEAKEFTAYPAVDVLDGRAVRLRQGRREEATDYGDPVEMAAAWRAQGAKWLHVVDLAAAFDVAKAQKEIICRMVKAFAGPVQLGGGIRSLGDVKECLEEWGIARCILGTAAVTRPELVRQACSMFPGKIACGIDAKDGLVAVRGWVDVSAVTAADLAKRMEAAGVAAIIYTDISRDGMLTGPNVEATGQLAGSLAIPVIASGGVASLQDLAALKEAGCAGAIIGKALYTGAFTLPEALNV